MVWKTRFLEKSVWVRCFNDFIHGSMRDKSSVWLILLCSCVWMALNQGKGALSTQSSGAVHSRSLLNFYGRMNKSLVYTCMFFSMHASNRILYWQMTKTARNISIEGGIKQINPQTHSQTDDLIKANIKHRLEPFHRKNYMFFKDNDFKMSLKTQGLFLKPPLRKTNRCCGKRMRMIVDRSFGPMTI